MAQKPEECGELGNQIVSRHTPVYILLVFRLAIDIETNVSAAQPAFGTELRLPGKFFPANDSPKITDVPIYSRQFERSSKIVNTIYVRIQRAKHFHTSRPE